MTLIDANVILDLVTDDAFFGDWSLAALHAAKLRGALLINDVVYAEASGRFEAIEALDDALDSLGVEIRAISRAALFSAGHAHRRYRENDGPRTAILPDFIIGAHAQDLRCPLLTRDVRRFRSYFPDVELITP